MSHQAEREKPKPTQSGAETPLDQIKHDDGSIDTAIEEDEQFRTNDTYGETDSNLVNIQGKIISTVTFWYQTLTRCILRIMIYSCEG